MPAPPLAPGHCQKCGAESQPNKIRCWLCGWSPADEAEPTAPPLAKMPLAAKPRAEPAAVAAPRAAPRPFQFTIAALITVTTVVAVCLGAFRAAPGFGILLVVVLALVVLPAMIRTRVIQSRRQQAGEVTTIGRSTGDFANSLAIAFVASIAGFITAAAVGYVAMFAAFFVACGLGPHMQGPGVVLIAAIIAVPVIAGVGVAVLIFRAASN